MPRTSTRTSRAATPTTNKNLHPEGVKELDANTVKVDGTALARLLRQAGHLRFDLSKAAKGEGGVQFSLAMEGASVKITVPEVIMSHSDYKALSAQPGRLRSRFAKYRALENPTVEELLAYGLPLYWNEDWLREKVDQCGTFAEVARTYSSEVLGVNATTIANYARDTFGWRVREETTKKRALALGEYEDSGGEITQTELAKRFGVSVSTINRWISNAHDAYSAMQKQHSVLVDDEDAQQAFCEHHNITPEMLARWLQHGSSVFSVERPTQRKQHYYSKAEYAAKRELARQIYIDQSGSLDKSALARELEVDRSTVTAWINSFDTETLLNV